MRLSEAIEKFIEEQGGLRKWAPYTKRGYRIDLQLFATFAGRKGREDDLTSRPVDGTLGAMFTEENTRAFMVYQGRLEAETIRRRHQALAGFGEWCVKTRRLERNPMLVLKDDRPPRPVRLPQPFSVEERDRLMLLEGLPAWELMARAIMRYAGLRVGEVVKLSWKNVRLGRPGQDGKIFVEGRKGGGKGDRHRLVTIFPDLDQAFRVYLRDASVQQRQLERGLVLVNTRNDAVREDTLRERVSLWGERADVVDCHPHRFRHTFATWLYELGIPDATIQKELGHGDIKTTLGYRQVADTAHAAAMQQAFAMLAAAQAAGVEGTGISGVVIQDSFQAAGGAS